MVVFGCISAKGWHKGKCLYNNDNSACSFGSLLGLVGFVASIAFLILEALFHNISSIKMRRRAVLLDLGFSGLNTNTSSKVLKVYLQDYGVSCTSFVSSIWQLHGENLSILRWVMVLTV